MSNDADNRLERYRRLVERAEDAERKAARLEGQIDALMKRLKEEFGCASLEEGEKLLRQLEKSAAKMRQSAEEAGVEFERKWGDKIREA